MAQCVNILFLTSKVNLIEGSKNLSAADTFVSCIDSLVKSAKKEDFVAKLVKA